MSSQRSDWRERLSVNPSRMEQELAIKLQDKGIRAVVPSRSRSLSGGPRGKKEKKLKLDEDAKKKAWPGEPSLDRRRLPDGQNPDSPLQNALESVWNRKPVHCHANPL